MHIDGSELSIIEKLTSENREATKHDFDQMELSPDTENALLILDPELVQESESLPLVEYLNQHLNTQYNMCKKISNDQIMRWSPQMISKPLLRIPSSLSELAIQLFKNLLSYMGDRKSSKKPALHLVKHIRLTINSPEELKDEAYVQVLKQIKDHKDYEKAMRGWNFLAVMASCFPPSVELYKSLIGYLVNTIKTDGDQNIVKKANYIAIRLMHTFESKRKIPPCEEELRHIEGMKPIMFPIYFFSGGSTTVPIESYTTVRDLKNTIMRKLQLNLSRIPYYALYELCDKPTCVEERFLDESEKIVDIQSVWAKEVSDYAKQNVVISFRVYLKIQLYYPFNKEDLDTVTMHYVQTNFDVIQGKFQLTENDITQLAAIALFVNHGTKNQDEIFTILQNDLKNYIPVTKFKLCPEDIWPKKIMDVYTTLQYRSKLEAKNAYLELLKDNPMFEAQQFFVKYSSKLNTETCNSQHIKNPDHITEDCIVGLKPKEILITDPERNELLRIQYNSIASWGVNSDVFVIVIRKSEKEFTKYYFESNQTKLFQILMDSYTSILAGKGMSEIILASEATCKMFDSLPATKLKPGQSARSKQATVYYK